MLTVEHCGEKSARGLMPRWSELGQSPRDPLCLQSGKLHGERLTFRSDVEEPLSAIVGTLSLQNIALLDQLPEHPSKRLLGDFENIQELRNLHSWIAVDEMQHPVMRASKSQLGQHIIRIANEVHGTQKTRAR